MSLAPRMRIIARIKQNLRDAPDVQSVNAVAVYWARAVTALSISGRSMEKTMAIQIKNMAAWRRTCIIRGYG